MINRKFIILLGCIFLLILMIIIMKKSPHEEEISPTATVKAIEVTPKPYTEKKLVYGTVNLPPDAIEHISVQSDMLVQQVFVVPGQPIEPNTPLVKLVPSNNVQLTKDNATLALSFAQQELARVSALRKQFLATNAELLTAQQNLAKAKIELLHLNRQLKNKNEMIVSAAHAGTVSSINVSNGQIVPANTDLLTLAQSASRQIILGIEPEDIKRIKVGATATISSLNDSTLRYKGRVTLITQQLDATTGLINAIVHLPKALHLIPGSMVQGEIVVQHRVKAITVPHSALLYNNKKPYVYVITNHKAQRRWVNVGSDNGKTVCITQGINALERVIVEGNYELSNGMNVVEQS